VFVFAFCYITGCEVEMRVGIGMAKRPNKDEIIREYIGINSETLEVETVSETRGGQLSKWTSQVAFIPTKSILGGPVGQR
jgi:hypothetical protein